MSRKRTFRELYEIIQGNNWSQLQASEKTIRRWKSVIKARGDVEQELENHGAMEFRPYTQKIKYFGLKSLGQIPTLKEVPEKQTKLFNYDVKSCAVLLKCVVILWFYF